ncbi:MAG: HdeD family acid-resistance protein [Beijerinckiaceae bacterium]
MTDITPTPPATPSGKTLASHLVPLRRNWGWILASGLLLLAMGTFGIIATGLYSLLSTFMFGAMMLAGGAFMLVETLRHGEWRDRIWPMLIALLYIVTGFVVFANPLSALVALTLFVAVALLISGALRLFLAFKLRPASAWVWMLIGGLVSLLLGAMIIYQWPLSGRWVLGTFLAIEMIFQGWANIALAMNIRSTFDGVKARAA